MSGSPSGSYCSTAWLAQRALDVERSLLNWDEFQDKAFDLLTSPVTQRAFDIEVEPPALRESYGRNIYGQSVLLARRLIEAGTRVACISWAPDANATWDTHGNNFGKLKTELLPQLDAAVSAPAGRSDRPRHVRADAGCDHGRVRPHAADQQ